MYRLWEAEAYRADRQPEADMQRLSAEDENLRCSTVGKIIR